MMKRTLAITIALTSALGCSSSNNTPAKGDAGSDAAKEGGGDAPADMASDGPTSDVAADAASESSSETGGDAPADGVVLTAAEARGQYLVNVVIACSDCHTPMKADGSPDLTKFLAGNPNFIVMPNGDKLPTRNLTNDATGLKNRTNDEIKNMFLNGQRPTATGMEALNPVMPYYVFHNMTTADADAIVAYLRTVPGVNNDIPRRSASFDLPAPANYLDPNKIPLPLDTFAARESALRGRYIASEAGICIECHTQHQMAADPINTAKLFQGGEDFSALFATTLMIHPVSKNLTSDNATGLGTWTAADIVKVLKQGKAKDGSGICPPMPVGPNGAFGHLLDGDAMDIANYIKSLPPATNAIVDMCVFPPLTPTDGGADATEGGSADASSDAGAEASSDVSSGDATGG